MNDPSISNQELLKELSFLKKKIKKLEESESQQKPTAMKLHKSEDKYRQLAEDMPAFICTFLPDSTLTYVNKAYCELFQNRSGDLIGQKFLEFLPDEATRENVRRQYMSLTTGNPVKTYENEVIVFDGTNQYHWHRWTVRAFFSDNGQISYFQSVGQDITEHKRIEMALRESESFLNTILNSIPIPVFYKDTDGRYLGLNKAFETLFGATKEQIIGKTVFDINPPDLAEIYHAKDNELFESGGAQHYESQVKNALGLVRDVIFNKAIFTDSKGAISGLIGAILDVTDRKQADEALRESETKYRTIVENIPQKIFIKDNVSRYVSVNENYARDLSIRPEEVKGKSDYDFFPKELAEKYRADDKRIMRMNRIENIEEKYIEKGCEVWIHTIKAPVHDEHGGISGVFGIFMDITRRKQAEQALRLHSEIMTNMNEGVILSQVNGGIIVYTNPKFEEMFGYDTGELSGKHISIVNAPGVKSPSEIAQDIISHLREHEIWKGEVYCQKKDRTPFWCYANVSMFNHAEYGEVWISVHSDITERKMIMAELERSYQQLRVFNQRWVEIEELERKRLSAELHDEIGQYLTALGINLSIVKMNLPPGADTLIHDRIDESFNLLKRTTAQIKGVMSNLRPTVLDEYGLVPALQWYTEENAKRTGIEIFFTADELPCRPVTEIEIALFRIAQEAINNAIKHARANRINMTLNYLESKLLLVIADDGAGFETQAVQVRNDSGWGLMIMRERCLGIKGRFRVESIPGQGTRIYVEVPL